MRGIWTAACLLGAAVFTVMAAFMVFMAYEARQDSSFVNSALGWAVTFISVAVACALGLFIKRSELDRLTTTDEPVRPAKWIEEMRTEQRRRDDP